MKIALYYRHLDETDQPAFDELLKILSDKHIDTLTVHDGETLDHQADGCDFLFSIGGDGTLLSSVQSSSASAATAPCSARCNSSVPATPVPFPPF